MLRWSVASASLTLFSLRVYALGKKKKNEQSSVRAEELSLYSQPEWDSRFEEQPRSSLEEAISAVRRAVVPYVSRLQDVYSTTRPTVGDAIQQSSTGCDCPWNSPPEALRRVGIISFSGLLGFCLARSSRLKRLLYPLVLMGATTSAYYPEEALRMARMCLEQLRLWSAEAQRRISAVLPGGAPR